MLAEVNVLFLVIITAVLVGVVDRISLLLLFEPLHHGAVLFNPLLLSRLFRVERLLADLVGVLVKRAARNLQLGVLLADDVRLADGLLRRLHNLDRLDFFR